MYKVLFGRLNPLAGWPVEPVGPFVRFFRQKGDCPDGLARTSRKYTKRYIPVINVSGSEWAPAGFGAISALPADGTVLAFAYSTGMEKGFVSAEIMLLPVMGSVTKPDGV
jgi:hypothetical protein